MHKLILPFAAACALSAISIVTAHAHASLEKGEAAPGSYKAVVKLPHGCDGQPTHSVHVEIPEGFIDAKPMPKAGWTLAVEKGDYAKTYKLHGSDITSGARSVSWSGGNLPDEFYDEFVISGTLSGVDAGQVLYFKVRQLCDDGELVWDEEPAAGQDPHTLDHPAPSLTILAADGGGHDHHAGGSSAVKTGDLELKDGWARAMLPGQPAGGAYLTITNDGTNADRLVGVASPDAGRVEIHTMSMKDNVMVMRPVEGGLEIPAGGSLELKPGGEHLMFMEVKTPFRQGDSVPVTLEFEKAGKIDYSLPVKAKAGGEDHSQH